MRAFVKANQEEIERNAAAAGTSGVLLIPDLGLTLPGDSAADALARQLGTDSADAEEALTRSEPGTYGVFVTAGPAPKEPVVVSARDAFRAAKLRVMNARLEQLEAALSETQAVVADGIRLSLLTREDAAEQHKAVTRLTEEIASVRVAAQQLDEASAAAVTQSEQRLAAIKAVLDQIAAKLNAL